MNRFSGLSFKNKLQLGCYAIVAVYSIAMLFFIFQSSSSMLWGLILLFLLAGLSFPFIRFLERTLTEPISDISRAAISISKGDFTSKIHIQSNDALGELANSFNRMTEKLREILKDTGKASKHVSDSSRDIFYKNEKMKAVLEEAAIAANELAAGANQISEEISEVSAATKDIEHKVTSYTESTREMNARSGQMLELVNKGLQSVETQSDASARTSKRPPTSRTRSTRWPS